MGDLYDEDILLWSERQGGVAGPARGGGGDKRRDRLAQCDRGDRERGQRATPRRDVAAAASADSHAESRGVAVVARCAELAGRCHRLSYSGFGPVCAVHAAKARSGPYLSTGAA